SYQIWASELDKGPFTTTAAKYRSNPPGSIKRIEDGWWNIWDRDQDDAAVESQGLVTDRTRENLGSSDRGIVMMRKMVKQSIEAMQQGKDPINVQRDDHPIIDLHAFKTNLGAEPGKIRNPEL